MGRPTRSLLALVIAVVTLAVAIRIAFPDHPDYVAHFVAGAGMTLGGLSVVLLLVSRPMPWVVIGLVVASIAVGAMAEATVFRLAAFDLVDFSLQSAGASLAAFPFLDGGSAGRNFAALACGAAMVTAGVAYLVWSVGG